MTRVPPLISTLTLTSSDIYTKVGRFTGHFVIPVSVRAKSPYIQNNCNYHIFISNNVNFSHMQTPEVTAISSYGQISGQTLITRYQASCEPHDVTSIQLLIVVWKRSVSCEERFVGVSISGLLSLKRYRSLISISLVPVWEVNFIFFNSMLKYVINRLMYAFFHIMTVIMPQPISTLVLKSSGRYRFLGMITVLIWKRACINL